MASSYDWSREAYATVGVDTEKALETLARTQAEAYGRITMQSRS